MALPIPLAKIAETEAALGATFPAMFKQRISRENGGLLHLDDEAWWLFPFRDDSSRETLRRSAEDIRRETARAIEADLGFPADGVAIAHNGAGDLLLLRREGARVREAVWVYRLRGGELTLACDDIATLFDPAD